MITTIRLVTTSIISQSYVCVCVCVRARERERERDEDIKDLLSWQISSIQYSFVNYLTGFCNNL